MTLQQLRYLLGIADSGLNITAAAERLFTSQPGISKQLKLLEQELGKHDPHPPSAREGIKRTVQLLSGKAHLLQQGVCLRLYLITTPL